MADEYIFRFLTVRGAQQTSPRVARQNKIELYPDEAKTALYKQLDQAVARGASLRELAKAFLKSPDFVTDPKKLPFDYARAAEWMKAHRNDLLETLDVKAALE